MLNNIVVSASPKIMVKKFFFSTIQKLKESIDINGNYVDLKINDIAMVNGYHFENDSMTPELGYRIVAESIADGYITHRVGDYVAVPITGDVFMLSWAGIDKTGQKDVTDALYHASKYFNSSPYFTEFHIPLGTYLVSSDFSNRIDDSKTLRVILFINKSHVILSCKGTFVCASSNYHYCPLITLLGNASWVVIDGIKYKGDPLPLNVSDYYKPPLAGITSVISKEYNSFGSGYLIKNCVLENVHYNAINFTNDNENPVLLKNISILSNKINGVRGHGIAIRHTEFANIIGNNITNIKRYDKSFVGMGVDISSGCSDVLVSKNFINNAPYGLKIESRNFNDISSSTNNRVTDNVIMNIGVKSSHPDDYPQAIKVNSSGVIVNNNHIENVFGIRSKGILINRAVESAKITNNKLINVVCGISDIPAETLKGIEITIKRKSVLISGNEIKGEVGQSAIELQWSHYEVSSNYLSSFIRGIHAFNQPEDELSNSIIAKNNISKCKYPLDIRGKLHNVNFISNETDHPVLLPYFMKDCLISQNIFLALTISPIGDVTKGDFKDCKISSNNFETLKISGGNLDCQPINISISDNILYQTNEIEGIGIWVTANNPKNRIEMLSIKSNKISNFYYGIYINVKSVYLDNNEFKNCYQNEVVSGDILESN
jgi:hypothetical protein